MQVARNFLRFGAAALAVALLASCGGGGGAGGDGTSAGLAASASLAEQCAAPRAAGTVDPLTGQAYGDVQGSLGTEKSFLRSWIDETYLWYQDVRALPAATLDANAYATPIDYFAVLKSPLTTASGKAKDPFHFTYPTATWDAISQSGVSYGYGFEVALVAATPPRSAIVAYTDPNTPATANGIARGASIVTVDGVDLANGSDTATLNAGLFPTAAGTHTIVVRDAGSSTTRSVTLVAQTITETPVQNVKTLPTATGTVGYLLFNDHIATAESELVAAVNTLKTANVGDLVLDLRYNGGGYLDIASELAYMIAGPGNTAGKFFERISFNDRNPYNESTAQATTDFHSTGQGFTIASGTALPSLGLSRVFVLTSADTCSASEAIINGLRGAGVTVNLVGGTTCGKPYGFFPKDNCSTTYFSINFQGVNNIGFGDYADGFAPTCAVADDYAHALGDPAEAELATALGYRAAGACTVTPSSTSDRAHALAARPGATPVLIRTPFQTNRIYRQSRP